ncbi:anaerobic ribonucleoside triphosphate reductase [Anaeromicropila herbilytica]|uniref:Anaerobic ribonucleoside triphosphate reductase n=1 Tax=Anaeromicropila herbilytica TaxID=2785025 RepID=A0A7R7IEH1_9FIRM|nr:anaerobic ribonucleoside triphosphate reductase [Anaeromicropila herbilytica]BCN32001.1 anaerobic ribonucleoside triphosphate reductase [Anaeromicropila herbilytica]
MVTEIKKRDGRVVEFNREKISTAIYKAFGAGNAEASMEEASRIATIVEEKLNSEKREEPSVEEIQDMVEEALMEAGYAHVAKDYILYRAERTKSRDMNTRLMKIYEDITFQAASENDLKRENANIDGDTAMGTMLRYGSEGSKQFYELFLLNPEHAKAHKEGDIHIHDLDFLSLTTTCCQIDLLKLFKGGFSTGHGTLREPNSILSASALAAIAIQSNQNDQHGGQSIVNFDYGLAPSVAKTYRKKYYDNLAKAAALFTDNDEIDDIETQVKLMGRALREDGFKVSLEEKQEYNDEELKRIVELSLGIDDKTAKKIQRFARKQAYKETDKDTYQAMEAFIHNLNTMHSRAGAQVPFSSINYGMDTSQEGRMVVKNILLAEESGLGNGETPIFPIQIFRVKEGINYNQGEPNYDLFKLACKVSAKRLFPNFSFQDAPFNIQYYKGTPETEIAYMGCRTRVIGNVYDKAREITNGRGNLSFTSINLPRIAIKAKGDVKWFFEELDRKIDLCIDQLLERFEIQARKKVKNYPFLMGQGVWIDSEKLGPEDEVREVLKHGTLSIGFIGLAETLKALVGKHHGESEEARELGIKIIGHMRDRMDSECDVTGLNFSLLATPAEGLSGRFVNMDKKIYGEIEGVTDREYYTNSFHVPVYYPISAFDKIQIEGPYHELTNAGHISYVELDGDTTKNISAFEKVIRAMHDAGMGYASINHPVDEDPDCGYVGIIDDVCPQCGRTEAEHKFNRIRRITGYLVGTLDRFNNGKRAEERDRVKHGVSKAERE